uniref:Mitochondrial carrier protein n=1 Tax=Arcella intermedia TaxID=1963864 RepID=A0A6B2LFR4_9EUKA|eukprot:TRINITY_DN5033_c0_g1_i1.p1 TRINITY_DN5033_c0_g1~~TRINITY_DN5033_c0_g1_i1.p1  ORF type:complete len:245 (-),score=26.11 TRINITY_DN5033_c0_g1_i1:180-914(-)
MVAGGMSRGIALSLLHPLDVAKTRIQFQRESMKSLSSAEGMPYYNNSVEALWSILRREGVRSLFKGLGIRWLYIWPSAAVTFTIYEQAKYAIKSREWNILPVAFLFGISVRAFSTLARTPFDIFKQHLQLSGMDKNAPKASIASIYKKILQEYGRSGLFHSFHVTILRDIAFSGTHFLSYELFKHLQLRLSFTRPDTLTHGLAGAAAGAVGTLCSIPVDVIKTRLQTQLQLPSQLQKYVPLVAL